MHTRARILYVDDDQDLRLMMLLLLEQSGYGVMTASNAGEALHLARSIPFDLYILDLVLPDKSGVELCRELQELHPGALVFYYTGYANDPAHRELLTNCGGAVLQKPVDLADLREVIASTLLQKDSKHQLSHGKLHRP